MAIYLISLEGSVYDFSVDCYAVNKSNILNIYKYLMDKNNIKSVYCIIEFCGSLAAKYVSLINEPCMARPTLGLHILLHLQELVLQRQDRKPICKYL